MRYLWIIRHAKSADGSHDHARELNPRGMADGPKMQAWYQNQTHQASWIWSSDATRAKQTAQFVAHGFDGEVVYAPELYLASPDTILDQLQGTPSAEVCAAVVAHNPGLTYLVNLLCGETITDNLPTFGSVLLKAPIQDWHELSYGQCEVQQFMAPRLLG